MPEPNTCPQCGAALTAHALHGLCPKCLLARVTDPLTVPSEGATADAASTLRIIEPLAFEKPGDRIGRYKLLQKLGEGGCGVVYMAEQEEPVKRLSSSTRCQVVSGRRWPKVRRLNRRQSKVAHPQHI